MEIAQGVLPDAQHLPMHLIPLKMNDLPKDRDVILYCRSGARSYQACAYLVQQGVDNVLNLSGGIIDWARQGFEVGMPAQA
jgi:rhodanese-related sulfurtransferase